LESIDKHAPFIVKDGMKLFTFGGMGKFAGSFAGKAGDKVGDLFKRHDSHADVFDVPVQSKYKLPKYFSDPSLKVNDGVLQNKLDRLVAEDISIWEKFRTGELDRTKFEVHHMVSEKSTKTSEHSLWEKSGLNPNDGINKVLLPKKSDYYPGRSTHAGRHTDAHHDRLIDSMNTIKRIGEAEGWTPGQFKLRFQEMLIEERIGLINGKTDLYMNKKNGKK